MHRQAAIPRGNVAVPAAEDFEDWVRVSSPRLRRLAFLLTGDLDEAEDLVQSAYAKVLPRWHRISAYDAPEAYMHRVMVNPEDLVVAPLAQPGEVDRRGPRGVLARRHS